MSDKINLCVINHICYNELFNLSAFCWKDPVAGPCRNSTNKWFFNRNESRCEVFTWTCGNNPNRFDQYEECIETCTGYSMALYNRRNLNRNMFDYNSGGSNQRREHRGRGAAGHGDHGRNRQYQQWDQR